MEISIKDLNYLEQKMLLTIKVSKLTSNKKPIKVEPNVKPNVKK